MIQGARLAGRDMKNVGRTHVGARGRRGGVEVGVGRERAWTQFGGAYSLPKIMYRT